MKAHVVLAATLASYVAVVLSEPRPRARFMRQNSLVISTVSDVPLAVPKIQSSPTVSVGNLSVSASVAPTITSLPTTTAGCGRISAAQASVFAINPSATATVPASWVEDCYKTVPLNVTLAISQIEGTKKYAQFQSTLAYLANPPAGYMEPALDFFSRLDDIAEAVKNGTYANELEWETAMYQLFHDAHDQHFVFKMGGINAFAFVSGIQLVSISEDGQKLPKIYHAVDILHENPEASPVQAIDGNDVESYLLDLSQQIGTAQFPDATYQSLFTVQGNNGPLKVEQPGFQGYFNNRTLYSGNTFNITFENGTTVVKEWMATVVSNFTGVDSGDSFYTSFIFGPAQATSYDMLNPPTTLTTTTASSTTSTKATVKPTGAPPGYPTPFVSMKLSNMVSGYFLENTSVAVLSLASFWPKTNEEAAEFQSVVQNFLVGSKAAGKTKVIIDLSGNPGGTIMQPYDTFKQFFPQIAPFGGSRLRATEANNVLGTIISSISGNATANDDDYSTPWNYRHYNNASGVAFRSWPALFGPVEANGDNFTNTIRYPLNDITFDLQYSGLVVTGYGNRSNFTTQPYESKDMIMLYDSLCASACSLFSEMMKSQGKVKAISVGGRPQLGVQVAVGGVKGVYAIEYDANSNHFVEKTQEVLNAIADPQKKAATAALLPGFLPLHLALSGVNFRDQVRPDSEFPLQFLFEASDCRIFYTADMIRNVTALWKEVVDITWGGKAGCLKGSTGDPSALPVDLEPVFEEFRAKGAGI